MTRDEKNNAANGNDSLGNAIRRNLSAGRLSSLFSRGWRTLRSRGWQALWREVDFRFRLATHREVWRRWADIPLGRELRAQRKASFPAMPLISVVVPLFNTPEPYLRQMVASVKQQSYKNWELILADASNEAHSAVGDFARRMAHRDDRVWYFKLPQNAGIAENTNAGFAECKGDWVTLLDHDDILSPAALYEVVRTMNETGADMVYSDEIVLDETLKHQGEYHFKPDFGPDTLRGCNYITHLCAFSRPLLERAGGGEDPAFDGAQDYDLVLRLTEQTEKVAHIPKILYSWRRHGGSTAGGIEQKPAALDAGARALAAHLARVGYDGTAQPIEDAPGAYRVRYRVQGDPLVSVLIPSSDHSDDLARCLESLYKRAGANMEVLVLDNNSNDPATEAFYSEAEQTYLDLTIHRYPGGFNFSAICNFGARRAKGDHLLLLNNDIEILREGFVAELLSYSQRPDVGAVGAMLYYPDDTVQHAGLFIGIGGTAGVSHKGHPRGNAGDMFRLATSQNMSAVTGAALMVKRQLYEDLGGMDEEAFAVAFNDVDLCLRLREKGYWNVFTPFAQAYHYESKSRGYDTEGKAKARHDAEGEAFRARHAGVLEQGDPFYNPHLTLKFENFGLR